ncbi:hypothetical protein SAMN05443575_1447 [Jatrophihabitans endophyticus]|uniref:Uncharacterized protein n=1 Tax=Jatrophihabitans endophyticus TaxID=1206085 RepID=A0A1M5HA04_9ACTN|nr:hypothetical protein [Jatrophihabitans endophyticus]SHG12805.1 hypothetical protein SAMN05443575_1447 [Jatrophihabitans endophyticus]
MTAGPRHGRTEPPRDPAWTPGSTVGVRRRPWAPGRLPFAVGVPTTGIELGSDRWGGRIAYPLLDPTHSTRIGVVAQPRLAALLAVRLLAQSCDLTVVTADEQRWQRLAARAHTTPFAVSRQLRRWPPDAAAPPFALLIDMPDPPPPGFARQPWSTVVHAASAVPHTSRWWQSAHLVLAAGDAARDLAVLRPGLAAALAERTGPDDLLAVGQDFVRVFRTSLRQDEFTLLRHMDPGGS